MTDAGAARPTVLILAGPNGAGKPTAAGSILKSTLALTEFVNADVIARACRRSTRTRRRCRPAGSCWQG